MDFFENTCTYFNLYCVITAVCSMYDYNVINCLVNRKVIWRQSLAWHHQSPLLIFFWHEGNILDIWVWCQTNHISWSIIKIIMYNVYVPTCTQSFNTSSLDCLFVIIQLHTYLPKNITLLRVYIIAKKPKRNNKKS